MVMPGLDGLVILFATGKLNMPTATSPSSKAAAVSSMEPLEYDAFLLKLTPKDRLNVERHIAAVELNSSRGHAKLWKKLATRMMALAPHSAKANGQQSMQFYIADGKYRMQLFALEDLRDGKIAVYANDAMDEAVKAGVVAKAKGSDEPDTFKVSSSKETLSIERLDGKTVNPSPFYKDMLGWNRRAAHIALPVTASDAQAEAVDRILVLAAKKAGVK
jgi:hypothetical protein